MRTVDIPFWGRWGFGPFLDAELTTLQTPCWSMSSAFQLADLCRFFWGRASAALLAAALEGQEDQPPPGELPLLRGVESPLRDPPLDFDVCGLACGQVDSCC